MISETHFTQKSYFNIPQYMFYHVNHPDGKAHGGSGILIKKNIKHYQTIHFRTHEIQATNIVIEDFNGPIILSSVYSPPKHNIKKEMYEQFFQTLGNRFLACGDYNAKHQMWGSRLTTTKGRQLFSAIKSLHLNVTYPNTPTYWPTDLNKIPDLIDFCVSKGIPPQNQTCTTSNDLSSDHSPVILHLYSSCLFNENPCKLHNKKTNWTYFRYLVSTNLNTKIALKSEEDINTAVEHLVTTIQTASWNATPPQTFLYQPSYSAAVRKKIKEKRLTRKQWQRTRCPADKRKLNRLTSELHTILKDEKNKRFETEMLNLDPSKSTDYSLWKAIKKIGTQHKLNNPIRKEDFSWARNNSEKAETFSKYLNKVFSPNDGNKKTPEYINQFLLETHQLDLPIKKFSKTEVKKCINGLKLNKAPGYDLITAKVLKELPHEGIDFLTFVFNACLIRSFFPAQWKVAQISMIPKPGKPTENPSSYRPISLLPILSKMLESLFLKRLMPIIDTKSIIPSHQFGFRKQHGTIEQVHRLVETIHTAFENKEYCTGIFLDISQAFDKVWHDGLLYKLKKLLPINYYLFLNSYIDNRHYFVKEGGEISQLNNTSAGVPQGSVMGPILYLLFTSDLPQNEILTIGTFADDTAALSVHKNPKTASHQLQIYTNSISSWLQKWRIRANETKSVQVTFTLNKQKCPPIKLNEIEIPQKDDTKYLGIHLDKKLNWKKHIQTKRKALDIQLNKIKYLIGIYSPLSLENKILVYKCILKPIWTYGIQLWGTSANSNLEILQRFQSKTVRMIAKAPWYVSNARLHRELKIPTIKEEIIDRLKNYKNRISQHPNYLAATLMSRHRSFRRLKRKAPQDLI